METSREPRPILRIRELTDIASNARKGKLTTISPTAFEAVLKFDAIFALERSSTAYRPKRAWLRAAEISHRW